MPGRDRLHEGAHERAPAMRRKNSSRSKSRQSDAARASRDGGLLNNLVSLEFSPLEKFDSDPNYSGTIGAPHDSDALSEISHQLSCFSVPRSTNSP